MLSTPKTVINRFENDYFFLSNFYASPIISNNILYPTVEHAFQATKTKDTNIRLMISRLKTPGEAKYAGRSLKLRSNWEEIKLKVMLKMVTKKFEIPALEFVLLKTGEATLIEGNSWKDSYWGVYNGKGENHLGRILMKVRRNKMN